MEKNENAINRNMQKRYSVYLFEFIQISVVIYSYTNIHSISISPKATPLRNIDYKDLLQSQNRKNTSHIMCYRIAQPPYKIQQAKKDGIKLEI